MKINHKVSNDEGSFDSGISGVMDTARNMFEEKGFEGLILVSSKEDEFRLSTTSENCRTNIDILLEGLYSVMKSKNE